MLGDEESLMTWDETHVHLLRSIRILQGRHEYLRCIQSGRPVSDVVERIQDDVRLHGQHVTRTTVVQVR